MESGEDEYLSHVTHNATDKQGMVIALKQFVLGNVNLCVKVKC